MELRKIKIAPGLYLTVDAHEYDIVKTPSPSETIDDLRINEAILLKQRSSGVEFFADIQLMTKESVDEHSKWLEDYHRKEHESRYLDVHSREQLMEMCEVRLLIHEINYTGTFSVCGFREDHKSKWIHYEEPIAMLDDFKDWVLQAGFVHVPDRDIPGTSFHEHLQRKKIEDEKRNAKWAAMTNWMSPEEKKSFGKRMQRRMYTAIGVQLKPERNITKVYEDFSIRWKAPLEWLW